MLLFPWKAISGHRIWQKDRLERLQSSYPRKPFPTKRENCSLRNYPLRVEILPTLKELRGGNGAQSTAPASELSPEAQQNPDQLHGTRPPQWEVTAEQPWHRIAAYLFATGCTSCKQVAELIGDINEKTVRNLLRQKWFQERVTKLLAENGGKDIMALLRAEQFNSLVVMLEIRDDTKTPAPVRANICRDIFDRTLGKPVQRIETAETPTSDDPVAEARRLKEELARSRENGA